MQRFITLGKISLCVLIAALYGYTSPASAQNSAQNSPQKTSKKQTSIIEDGQTDLPQTYSIKSASHIIDGQSELVIKGTYHTNDNTNGNKSNHGNNDSNEASIVIMRFDDHRSDGYRSRLNIERAVTPGPFAIHLPLFGLKTENGRLFDWQQWQQFIVFANDDNVDIRVNHIAITRAASFSPASMGFDLGSSASPVFRGLQQITPDYSGIRGQHLRARHHVSGNALTTDGIQGIETLDLPLANGRWQVTLWFAMEGEWENLPRQQHQHILLQGKTIWRRDLNALQWLQKDYLDGQYQEAFLDGNPWQLFGDKPRQRVTATAVVTDGFLHLRFAGQTIHDNYLAGLFITPADLKGSDSALFHDAVKERFSQKWQVSNHPPQTDATEQSIQQSIQLKQVYFNRQWQPDIADVPRDKPVVTTLGSHAVLDFSIQATQLLEGVQLNLELSNTAKQKITLPVEIRQGIWRYYRPGASATLLALNANELQTVYPGKLLRLPANLSRRINLRVPIPADFAADSVNGQLSLRKGQKTLASTAFKVEVLKMTLPPIRQSVGIYHDKSPHWLWFEQLKQNATSTLACDYRYLKQLGYTALSPPLATPEAVSKNADNGALNEALGDSLTPYLSDLKHYQQYFQAPAMDYTTIKRFNAAYHNDPLLKQRHLRTLDNQLTALQLPAPRFAVADEVPLLNDSELSQFSRTIAQLQNAMPSATFVGQLNKPANRQLVPMLDTLLLNDGYGVDKSTIKSLQRRGKSVWFYNMGRMRLAAGFYLWQSQAQGYLQWHGRMPTGLPFNPLDGRESDFQLIYPALQGCVQTPDIHADLLAISEGIKDRQWLNWLLKAARTDAKAKQLLAKLRKEIPDEWDEIMALPEQQVHQWRAAITDLASAL